MSIVLNVDEKKLASPRWESPSGPLVSVWAMITLTPGKICKSKQIQQVCIAYKTRRKCVGKAWISIVCMQILLHIYLEIQYNYFEPKLWNKNIGEDLENYWESRCV